MSQIRSFVTAVAERAAKTAAQAALATIGAQAALNTIQWAQVGYVAGGAAVISILMSIASGGATGGSPSLAGETLKAKSMWVPTKTTVSQIPPPPPAPVRKTPARKKASKRETGADADS